MASRRDVPEQVLFDILLFLPVISLLRFKTISKSWCSLIESSTFILQHLYHNGEKNNLIFVSHESKIYMLSGRKYDVCSNLNFKGIYPKNIFKIVNSCNGILCLAHMSGDYWHLSLWNPATKQVRKLPESSYLRKSGRVCHAFGLGFDKITNDYKIVRMSLYPGMFLLNDSLVQMYSMRTDSWRTIHEGDDFPIAWIEHFVNVACNGEMCLWIGRSFSNILIFYFDFANEVYGTVPFPDDGHRNARTYSLGFLNDKIACIKCRGCYKTSCSYYEIWMMNELGKKESWNKVYKLEEPILPYRRVGLKNLLKNGEFILTTKEGGTDDGLYLYNVVTQEETLLLGVHQVGSIINYNESLVSVKSANRT